MKVLDRIKQLFAPSVRFAALLALVCAAGSAWAATPVAEWTDFRNLTSGNYTWTADASCSVDANGVLTIGSSGGLYMTVDGIGSDNRAFTLEVEADIPTTFASNTAIVDLIVNNAHVSAEAKGTTLTQYWNGGNNGQSEGYFGTVTLASGRQLVTLTFYGASGYGTSTFVNGNVTSGQYANSTGLMSSSNKVTLMGVGCYNKTSRAANGMKIYAIRLYDSKLATSDVSSAYTTYYPASHSYLTLSGSTTQWSSASWTTAAPGASDFAKVNVTDDSTLNLDDSATAVKMSDFYVAAGKTLTLTGDFTKAGKVKFTGPGKVANWNTINLNIAADSNSLTTSEKVGMSGVGVTGTLWDNLGVSSGNHTSGNFNFGKVVDASSSNSLDYRFGVAYSGTRGAWHTDLGSSDNLRYGYLDDQNADGKKTPTVNVFGIPFDKYRVIVYHSTDEANVTFGYDTVNGDNLYYDSNLVLQSGTTAWGSSGPYNSAHPIAEGTNTLVSGVYTTNPLTVIAHRGGRAGIAAVQIVKVEETTINSTGTYTLAGLFGGVGDTSDFIINVEEDATLNIPANTTIGAVEFNVASGKTLTLTGNTLTASRCITVKGSGMVATSVMNVLAGTIKGNGTLCYDMNNGTTKPTGLTCTKAAWTGVLWIKNSAYTGWLFKDYGSTASTVRIENVTCYLDGSETLNSTLDLVGEGLKITNGNGYTVETVKKLTGSGTLTLSGGSANGNGFVIQDASEFYGTIQNTSPADGSRRYKVTIGGSGTYGYDRNMVIANGYTGTIANGKTWTMPGGFEVSGTLAFAGTGTVSGPVTTFSGSTLDLSGFTGTAPAISGTLTLASGTTIKLPSGATLPYQIASAGDGWANNVTVEIDGGATVTGGVKLSGGVLSSVKAATISTPGAATFSSLSWSGTGDVYLLTISGSPAFLTFDDVSGVEELKIVVENNGQLYVAGDLPENFSVDGLTALMVADNETLSLAADYTRLYSQIGTTSTGNGAISSSGTTISVANAMNVLALTAGNYTIARWLTPQVLSTGYGAVAALPSVTVADGLTAELVYMVDRIVLRVYDATAQAARGTIKIWPYGDSITEGYNASNTRANYRVLLGQKLKLLGYNVEMVGCFDKVQTSSMQDAIDPAGQTIPPAWKWHSAKHGGTIGVTAATGYQRSSMLESVDTHCAQVGNPDVVLLHGGINDLYASGQTVQSVFDNWTNVVEHILTDLPNTKVVVSTLLYCDAADSGRKTKNSTLVEPFNTAVKNFLASPPATWSGRVFLADLNSYFAASRDDAAPAGTTVDNLHPDWWGHDQMAEGWLSVVTNQFTASQTFPSATAIVEPTSGELGAANKAELADYRRGFKRYGVINVSNDLDPSNYTYSNVVATAAASGIARVGYFVEYVRADNNVSHWVWVDMDAFGTTIADLGLPAANHQQVVNNLHVKSSHNGIDDVAADDNSVQGWIEFTPFTYTGTSSGVTGAPAAHGGGSMFDWNDTLGSSGTEGCMQVFRKATPSGRPAQTLFAFNNWNQDATEAEFGIGNFSQHFNGGAQTFDYTETASLSQMNASAYSVKTIEIWTNPDKWLYSNDLKGSSQGNGAISPTGGYATKSWITIPGEGKVVIDSVILGNRSDGNYDADNRRVQILDGETIVATSGLINGDGVTRKVDKLADGGWKQTFAFDMDCVLTRGKEYVFKVVDSSGNETSMPSRLENKDGALSYSVITNNNSLGWLFSHEVAVSRIYEATLASGANTFSGLTFSPALPPDPSGSAVMVNVPAETTAVLTFGSATTVGSIRFNIPHGSTLTIADPSYLTAGKIVVYGTGTLSFGASPDFGDADIEIVDDATLELAVGQTLTTTGDVTIDSGATLTLAPATIADLSASLVSAASISGEIALTAPDESSDYSIVTTSTAVTLRRTTKSAFAYEAYPNGGSPSGWFSAWNNTYGDNFSETSLRVGPSATIPYVYHVSSSSHPYYDLTARSSVSFAVYADVSQMQSSKGIIACFGNSSNGLLMYRNGDWIVAARISGGSVDRSWVPGVAVANGYHLYTVTYNSSNGKVAVYRDGNVSSASDGSAEYPHFASGALNAGFQFGTTYGGSNPTGFNNGEGLAVAAMRGYDVALQPEEVAVIAESFPATDGNVDRDIRFTTHGSTVAVYENVTSGHYLGADFGTLNIPDGAEISVPMLKMANASSSDKTVTLNIDGVVNITTTSDANVWGASQSGSRVGVLLGEWHGTSVCNVTGQLLVPNAYVQTSKDVGSSSLNINSGIVKAKGLNAAATGNSVTLSGNGVLEVEDVVSTSQAIAYNFSYGTYRQKTNGTVTHTVTFSGTQAQPTTLDPYGYTMTLSSMSGNGYITVADSSDGHNGTVVLRGSTCNVILTDANAANIDISGYTGTVLYQGTESETLELLDGFAGTVYFTGNVDATGIDLSGATVHIADDCEYVATAGKEGRMVVGTGVSVTLNVDNETFWYDGCFPAISGSCTLTYHNTDTDADIVNTESDTYVVGNNLLPYYYVWELPEGTYSGSISDKSKWRLNAGVAEADQRLPESGKNVAFYVNGATTINIDAGFTYNEIQVYGSGSLTFTGTGTLNVNILNVDASVTMNIAKVVVAEEIRNAAVLTLLAETDTYDVLISGSGSVTVGSGAITFNKTNTFTGGLVVNSSAVAKTTGTARSDGVATGFGAYGGTISVYTGGQVDVANTTGVCYDFVVEDGGATTDVPALTNSGDAIGNTQRQARSLTINADAILEFPTAWGLINNGYNGTSMSVKKGVTVTKKGTGDFWLCNTAISATGETGDPPKFIINEGRLHTIQTGSGGAVLDVEIEDSATLYLEKGFAAHTITVKDGGAMSMAGTDGWLNGITTVTIDEGGTVDCTGTSRTGNIINTDNIVVNGTLVMGGKILAATNASGTGRVEYTGKLPDSSSWSTGTSSTGWRGTVAVTGYKSSGSNPWYIGTYGNSSSVLEVDDCYAYYTVASSSGPTLKLVGSGLKIANGNSGDTTTYAALSGSGPLVAENAPFHMYKFGTAADFTGSITNNGRRIVFGTSSPAQNATGAYSITLDSAVTAGLGDGATWKSNKINLSGILDVKGAGRLEGTVTLNGGTTLKFNDLGDGETAKCLTITGQPTLPSGYVHISLGEGANIAAGVKLIGWDTAPAAGGGVFTWTTDQGALALSPETDGLWVRSTAIEVDGVEVGYLQSGYALITNAISGITIPSGAVGLMTVMNGKTISFSLETGSAITGVLGTDVLVYASDANGDIMPLQPLSSYYFTSSLEEGVLTISIDETKKAVLLALDMEATTPMAMSSAGAPSFTIKPVPYFWYAIESCTTQNGTYKVGSGENAIVQPTSNASLSLSGATAIGSGETVRYYKIAVAPSKAALVEEQLSEPTP